MVSEAWFAAPCAEFPNGNAALHRGAVWECADVVGAPSCEFPEAKLTARADPQILSPSLCLPVQPLSLVADDEDDEDEPGLIEVVDELTLDGAVDEFELAVAAPGAESDAALGDRDEDEREPAAHDPFVTLVGALEDTALALGAGEPGVACLRALFGVTRWDAIDAIAAADPGAPAIEALLAGRILVRSEARANAVARASGFTEQVLAWQGILRGETEDFALCAALDEWAADVLARVLGAPARAETIRRELRRRGVAAFGLVANAA
jgi:hypothetical protein